MLKSDAKQHFGSLEAIAEALGITKSAVSQWRVRVPEGAAYKLQVITGGRLRVKPSLYPRIKRGRHVTPPVTPPGEIQA